MLGQWVKLICCQELCGEFIPLDHLFEVLRSADRRGAVAELAELQMTVTGSDTSQTTGSSKKQNISRSFVSIFFLFCVFFSSLAAG